MKTRVKIELSNDISSMSGSLKFIFYSSRVLMSTTKLQSISLIGPLVFKIQHSIFSAIEAKKRFNIHVLYIVPLQLISGIQPGDQNIRVLYLEHQWSDEADTLWFCSTDEYSKTTKYEPPNSSCFSSYAMISSFPTLCLSYNCHANRPVHKHLFRNLELASNFE